MESEEAAAIADSIAFACRVFMREFNPGDQHHPADDFRIMAAQLKAMRAEVGRAVTLALHVFGLATPSNLDLSEHDVSARLMLEDWNKS